MSSMPLRVLYLEDEPEAVRQMAQALQNAGFAPFGDRVDSRAEFLAHLDPTPDLVLSNYTVPGFDGLDAMKLMNERKMDIPFIFVSGRVGEERAVDAMQEGASDFILKDRLGRLGQAVKQALARRGLKGVKVAAEHLAHRLAAIVETSNDAIIAKTLDGIITTWNPAAERLYGYSAKEIIGKHISVIFPQSQRCSDAIRSFHEMMLRLSNDGHIPAFEAVRVRKDGRRIEVLLRISPLHDEKGAVTGASAIAHDITQRKQAERFLAAEQTVSGVLTDSKGLAEAGPKVLQAIAECFRWEVAVLWTVDRTANVLQRMHIYHSPAAEPNFLAALSQRAILEPGMGIAGRTWSTGESVMEPGINGDNCTAEGPAITHEGLRCGFGLPMRHGTDIVGVIEFYNPEIRELDKFLITALENIACRISQFCERRRIEAALRASEEQYRTLANTLPGGVYTCEEIGECDYCNQWWSDYTGLTVKEILHHGWAGALHPEDRQQTIDHIAESKRTGHPFQREHRFRGKDGLYRWFLDRSVPLKDSEGRVIKWFGTRIDIDEQKRGSDELRISEERFRNLVMSLPAAVYTTDQTGLITLFNENAVKLWGRSPVLGKDRWVGALKMFRADGTPLPFDQSPIAVTLREGRSARREEIIIERADGSRSYVLPHPEPLRGAAGEIIGAVNMLVDLTQMKQLEEQFRQSQKMEAVGRLAGGVAHDFNNLLTVINGYGEMMLGSFKPGDRNRGLVREIINAGERAADLTVQLLAFSRHQVLLPQVLNLNAILAGSEKMLRRLIGEDVEVKAIKDPALGNVKADPIQVQQVLLNLAVNARDAMPGGGNLVFRTENVELSAEQLSGDCENAPGPYVLLTVSDSGCGMNKTTLARIFEPFFTTKGTAGTGLGLATVFGIVKQSHGKIEVVSEPGHGTTFKIYLPLVVEPLTPTKSPANVPESLRGSETILLAEDDAGVRALTRHLLQANGYTVLEAANGAEAIRMFEKRGDTIALLITDVVMPNMSGRQLAEHLMQKWPNTKLLYVSGYTEDAVVHYGVYHDQTHFLQKPFNPAGLARKVREVLNARGPLGIIGAR